MLEDAESHAMVGQCAETRREAAAGLALSRNIATLEHGAHVLALCGSSAEAVALVQRVGEALSGEHPDHAPLVAGDRRIDRAWSEGTRQKPSSCSNRSARTTTQGQRISGRCTCAGRAYLQLKDGRRAATEFQGIIDHRGVTPASPLYALAHVGLARAATLQKDPATARREYQAFFDLWKDADPDLQPMKDARAEYSRL
jgi:hypothetical protein